MASYLIQIILIWLLFTSIFLSKLRSVRKRLSEETIAILATVMLDFQEAQVWWTIASQVASLMGRHLQARFRATSILQLQANWQFLSITSTASMTCCILGLVLVMVSDISSLCICSLTVTAMALSLALFFDLDGFKRRGRFDSSNTRLRELLDLTPFAGIKSCGGQPPPTVLCGSRYLTDDAGLHSGFPSNVLYLVAYGVSAVTLALALLWHINRTVSAIQTANDEAEDRSMASRCTIIERIYYTILALTKWPIFGLVNALIAFYIWSFARLFVGNFVDDDYWGLGQVVALSLWYPWTSRTL